MSTPSTVAASLPKLSPNQVADYLIEGFWEGFIGTPGPFTFDLGENRSLSVNLTGLDSEGVGLARAALDAWSDVSGIKFTETGSSSAQIMFQDHEPGGFGGPTLIRGDEIETSVVNVSSDYVERYGSEVGSLGFFFYLHEVGHALGLGHPGQYNASADFGRDASFANDSWQMSVMSYFDQDDNPDISASYAVPVTPMMADVVAIHRLYGTGDGVNTGDTAYGGGGGAGGEPPFFGTAQDPVTQTIVDSGGQDTINLRDDPTGVRLDMRGGTYSDILGLTGNLAIAPGTTVENALLGGGRDDVTGNGTDNEIWGGGGNDMVRGGGGNDLLVGEGGSDTLDGGGGIDTALYSGAMAAFDLEIKAGSVRVEGSNGTDTLRGIEKIQFGSGDWFASGGTFDLDAFKGVAALTASELTTFVEMYIAYFNRAPDAAGLYYWGTRLEDGMGLGEIAASFFVQEESRKAFPNAGDSAALVDAAYANLLERAPDAAGRAYWIEQLDDGFVSRAEFMLAVINGAKANPDAVNDVRTVTDKADIGLYYAVINGMSDVDAARDVMEAYDRANPGAGLAEARARVDEFADDAGFTMSLVGVVDDPFAA